MRIKRGADLLLDCTVTGADGLPMDLTGWTIASEVRDMDDVLLGALTVELHTPAAGQYRLRYEATDAWPTGPARMDIAYTDAGGRALTSETLKLSIEREVTQR